MFAGRSHTQGQALSLESLCVDFHPLPRTVLWFFSVTSLVIDILVFHFNWEPKHIGYLTVFYLEANFKVPLLQDTASHSTINAQQSPSGPLQQ